MPIIALITIQKTAPAPPELSPAATPTMLPRAHARGECGGERLRLRYRAFAGFPALLLNILPSVVFIHVLTCVIWKNPDRTLSRSPVPVKATSSGTPQTAEFIEETSEQNESVRSPPKNEKD